MKFVQYLFQHDPIFRVHLLRDAENSYSVERMHESVSKERFIEKAVEDILEQCACILVLSQRDIVFSFTLEALMHRQSISTMSLFLMKKSFLGSTFF